MFCRNCGSRIMDDAMYCPNCGAAVNYPPPLPPQQPYSQQYQQPQQYRQPYQQQQYNGYNRFDGNGSEQGANAVAIVGFVLAFIIPLAGLICSIIGYNNSKRGASYLGLALAGIIISAVWMGITLMAFIILISQGYIWYFYYWALR